MRLGYLVKRWRGNPGVRDSGQRWIRPQTPLTGTSNTARVRSPQVDGIRDSEQPSQVAQLAGPSVN
jgi:hypothetical protein